MVKLYLHTKASIVDTSPAVFKIKVLNAVQMRSGPSKSTFLKTTFQNATPNWKWRRHLKGSI